MSRGRKPDQATLLPDSFRIWVLTVQDQHRVRFFREEAASCLPWLNNQASPIRCIGTVGAAGGLLVSPEGAVPQMDEWRQALDESLRERPFSTTELSSRWLELTRYFATAWPLTIHREALAGERERLSLQLPEEIRTAGIVPSATAPVVLFAAGSILEVWPLQAWLEHVRAVGRRFLEFGNDDLEALRSR